MQLDRVEACLGNGGTDVLGVGIDEEPHTTDEGREASRDGRGPPRFNEPRRSGHKDKPQRVGPGFDGCPSIFLSGDAADLDAQSHGVRDVFWASEAGPQNCRSVTAPSLAELTVAAYLARMPRV